MEDTQNRILSDYDDFIRWIGYGHAEPVLDGKEKKWKVLFDPIMEFTKLTLDELYEYYKKEQK